MSASGGIVRCRAILDLINAIAADYTMRWNSLGQWRREGEGIQGLVMLSNANSG
jgi:hypothetical protein